MAKYIVDKGKKTEISPPNYLSMEGINYYWHSLTQLHGKDVVI